MGEKRKMQRYIGDKSAFKTKENLGKKIMLSLAAMGVLISPGMVAAQSITAGADFTTISTNGNVTTITTDNIINTNTAVNVFGEYKLDANNIANMYFNQENKDFCWVTSNEQKKIMRIREKL